MTGKMSDEEILSTIRDLWELGPAFWPMAARAYLLYLERRAPAPDPQPGTLEELRQELRDLGRRLRGRPGVAQQVALLMAAVYRVRGRPEDRGMLLTIAEDLIEWGPAYWWAVPIFQAAAAAVPTGSERPA